MSVDSLSNDHHVVRYVKPSLIDDDDSIDGSAFVLREEESGISVNWLEAFGHRDSLEAVQKIRNLSRLNLSNNGSFVKLNVRATKDYLNRMSAKRGRIVTIDFIKSPLEATEKFKSDQSHAEITGVPNPREDELYAVFVGDLIAQCI